MGKRRQISLEEKYNCISAVEKNLKTQAQLCREMGLRKSTICQWLSLETRNKIKLAFERSGASSKKKLRSSKYFLIDEALFMWTKQRRNVKITNGMLTQAAVKFGTLLNEPGFDPNNGWVDRFKKRYEILVKSSPQKSKSVNSGGGSDDYEEATLKSEEEIVDDIMKRLTVDLSMQENGDDGDDDSNSVHKAAVKQESDDFADDTEAFELDDGNGELSSMHENGFGGESTVDGSHPSSASALIVDNNQPCRSELNRCLSTIRLFYLNQDDNVDALLRCVNELETDVNKRFKNSKARQNK
jgi:transposase-like protein